MNPKLTIQIVTWNSEKHLQKTLGALKDLPQALGVVRVIDNGSQDGTVACVKMLLPQADLVVLPHNIGFARAHNLGFAKCTTEFVMTHDPDVTFNPESLPELLNSFDDETVAAVQGKLYRVEQAPDERPIIDSAGIVHTATLNGRERGASEIDNGQYNATENVLAVTGAAGIFRITALEKIAYGGGNLPEVFDEDFFAYKEDVDLGWRLNRAGFVCRYEQAIRRIFSPRTRYSIRNYVWMLVKNISWKQEIAYGIPIAIRLAFMVAATVVFFPLFSIWLEVAEDIPTMIRKRSL